MMNGGPLLGSRQRLASSNASPRLFAAIVSLSVGVLFLSSGTRADTDAEARYPFDPACPWGRVANGQGMLKRCLSEAEAKRVFDGLEKAPKEPVACSPVVATTGATTTGEPSPISSPRAAPAEAVPSDGKATTARPFSVKLAQIQAEEGEIGLGKLTKPMDRYRKCVEDGGGLTTPKASVTLSFLVRAEMGRAEGVEVKRVSGVSKAIAQCLADVVDRRATGTPTSAMTGVTLTIEIAETK